MSKITRNFNNIQASKDIDTMLNRFDNTITKVHEMINKQTVYSTWIKFQLGVTNYLVFDSTSNDSNENLICSLEFNKSGAGIANDFTLKIAYDPFNMGQNSKSKIEQLDEWVAESMAMDFNSDTKQCKGYLQYGYNNTDDNELISPSYEFMLTECSSDTNFANGIGTFIFKGTSIISTDSEFTANFNAINSWNLMDIIDWHLYYYYGNSDKGGAHVKPGTKTYPGALGYLIDIPDKLFEEAPTISFTEASGITPWAYCESVLENQISVPDAESDQYKELDKMSASSRPKYIMYITDDRGQKTIHVNYISPLRNNNDNKSLKWEFTWNEEKNNSLVIDWSPTSNSWLYIIQKTKYLRDEAIRRKLNPTNSQVNSLQAGRANIVKKDTDNVSVEANDINSASAAFAKIQTSNKTEVTELYDAKLTTVGFPCDVPLAVEVRILPKILESVSRTSGVYMINKCTDQITNKGLYTSTFELFRLRSI